MGDLKKKKTDYLVRSESGEYISNENRGVSSEEQIIKRLREYMKRFYDIEVEKMENKEKENE